MVIAGFLRGLADFVDAVQAAYVEQRAGFREREAGDYLDEPEVTDASGFPQTLEQAEAQINRLASKLYKIRTLTAGWRASDLHGISEGDLTLYVAAGSLLEILNEGINFWVPETPPAADRCDRSGGADSDTVEDIGAAAAGGQTSVSHEDLAAHITAIQNGWLRRGGPRSASFEPISVAEEIATDLLSDYSIAKK